ncbi:MAG TPA: copper-binding protein [Alphaproteobacteria bacterium]|nr:copper-binding protein [Alphaproteobacteria bacterium]
MRLYKVVILVNLALGVGFVFGSLWWGREVGRLRREVELARPITLTRSPGERRWSVRGIVRVVAPEINRIFIDHENIPGLMQAMTMAFEPADPTLLNGVTPGDRIRFTLQEQANRLILVGIEKAVDP